MDSNSAQNIFKYAAVVPAAGLSSRMGAFKPLLDLGGKPLICRTLDSLRAGGCEEICVVTGYRADELEAAAAAPDVRFVRNPDYASTGMLESVQRGLSELLREDPPDFVILLPGDVPLVNGDTMRTLKETARNGAVIARPSHQGKAGHPALLDRAMAGQLLAYSGPEGVRGFLRGHADETVFLETDDPGILADVDTPEDYQKWNK